MGLRALAIAVVPRWRRRPAAIVLGALGVVALLATLLLLSPARQAAARPRSSQQLTAAAAYWLTAARERLIQACMHRQGYSYVPFLQNQFTDQLFPLALTDTRWARRYGFGSGTSAVLEDPNEQRMAHSSRSEQKGFYLALDGSQSGPAYQVRVPGGGVIAESATGCYTTAQKQLYGSAASWFGATTLASLARMSIISKVQGSPEYQSAVSAWSGCMARRGLDYPSPAAAREAATTPGQALPDSRVTVAVAESACARRTPLARVSVSLYSRQQHRLPEILQAALRVQLRLELNSATRAISIGSAQQDQVR
jgi:hypothetical protein